MKNATQLQKVLAYILKHGSITDAEAREHCGGCTRLAAVKWKLKHRYDWPVYAKDEEHKGEHEGNHARYQVDWFTLARNAEIAPEEVRELAWKVDPLELGDVENFHQYLVKNGHHLAVPPGQVDFLKDPFGRRDVQFHGHT